MAATTLTGTTGNDTLNAPGSVATLVQGLAGTDTITLVAQSDEAQGGDGNDSVIVNFAGVGKQTITGGKGNDTVTINSASQTDKMSVRLGEDNDLLAFTGGSLVSSTFAGNQGNDTVSLLGGATLSFVGAGQGSDSIAVTAGAISNTTVFGGKGSDTINFNGTGAHSFATLNAERGNDRVNLTGTNTFANSTIGLGKGFDSLNMGTGLNGGTIAGGSLDDTISFAANLSASGVIYGDAQGEKTGTSGSGNATDGADLIGTTALSANRVSIYGAGGNDTIGLAALSGSYLLDGGNGADLIGFTAGIAASANTMQGGAGNDTIRLLSGSTASNFLILGGADTDSIFIGGASGGQGSINGGAGADTISILSNVTTTATTGRMTINGGDGADVIVFSGITAVSGMTGVVTAHAGVLSTALCGNIGSIVYGAGDKIQFNSTGVLISGANWRGTGAAAQIYVASSISSLATGQTANGAGSIGVFDNGDDLIISIKGGTSLGTTMALLNIVGGDDALKTTAVGNLSVTSTNFAFTINRLDTTNNTGISIDFT